MTHHNIASESGSDSLFSSVYGSEVGRFRGVTAQLETLLAKLSEEHEREVSSLRLWIRQLEAELLQEGDQESPHVAVVRPRARSPRGAIGGKAQQAGMEKALKSFDAASPLPVIYDSESSADVEEYANQTSLGSKAHANIFQSEDKAMDGNIFQSENKSGVSTWNIFPSEGKVSELSEPSSPKLKRGGTAGSHNSGPSHAGSHATASHTSAGASIRSGPTFVPRDIWIVPDDVITGARRKSWENLGESSLRMTQSLRRSSNDLSLVLNEDAEEAMIKRSGCLFLHPQSNRRIAWDITGLCFVGYDVVIIPLQVFDLPEGEPFFLVMQMLGAIFWTLDIMFNFFTGFYSRGILEVRPLSLVKHYLRTWFILDASIAATEWVDIIVDTNDSATSTVSVLRAIRVVRCLRMVRLLRLLKLVRIEMVMQDLEAQIHSNALLLLFGILKLIMGLMLINHIIACIWYWIGKSSEKGWTSQRNLETHSGLYFYLTAVHWSLTQFQASMEIHPHTPGERAYGIFVVLVALILFSSFLSSITNMMRQLQTMHQEQTRRQRLLHDYFKEHGISSSLQMRLRRFLFINHDESQELQAQIEALRMLPQSVLMDVHNEAFCPHLAMHQFFCDLREENPRLVRQLCHESLIESIVQSDETIFCTGDACIQMLWVHRGLLQYKLGRQKVAVATSSIAKLRKEKSLTDAGWEELFNVRVDGAEEVGKDHWLSEPVLWTPWEHTGECKTLYTAGLLIMDALTFCRVIRRYESMHIVASLYARKFLEELNKALHPSDLILPPENSDVATLRLIQRSQARTEKGEMARRMSVDSVGSRISIRSTHTGLS